MNMGMVSQVRDDYREVQTPQGRTEVKEDLRPRFVSPVRTRTDVFSV
jgi:hypothetical protein